MKNFVGKVVSSNDNNCYIVVAQKYNDAVVMKLCRPEYVVITDLEGFIAEGKWANGRYFYVVDQDESINNLQDAINKLK